MMRQPDGQTAFVTGGAGFIGSHLVRELLAQGRRVVVYDNFFTGRRQLLPVGEATLEVVEGTLLDEAALRGAMHAAAPGQVYHLAALHYIPYCNEHPVETMMVNVAGTEAVFAACREVRPARVIYASSAAVYPVHSGPCSEELAVAPVDIYGWSKAFGEGLLRQFVRETQISAVAARLFNVYGPGETNPHLIPDILVQVGAGRRTLRLGNLSPRRDFVYVTDVVSALREIAEAPLEGMEVFNIGTGKEYAVTDVVAALSVALGIELRIEPDPARVRPVDRPHLVADVSRIRQRLGWQGQLTLEEGLRVLADAEGLLAAHTPGGSCVSPIATPGR